MMLPVAILAVLAAIGGWIQFAPFWTPVTDWLSPVVETLHVAEPTRAQEYLSSILALALGAAGIYLAYLIWGTGRVAAPKVAFVQRVLEHKFYVDELYDALFYRPASAFADRLRRDFEEPVVLASGPDLGETAFDAGRAVRRMQTGLLRTYVLFLGLGTAILAVVFLAVR
jgi:NADH-quinone oxidoreductase subunit L